MTGRRALLEGVRDVAPLVLGVLPFALVSGAAAVAVGLSLPQALGMAALVYAGAAQLAAVQLLGQGAPLLVVAMTAGIINLRFLMYGASIAPHFQHVPLRWKALVGYLLTDQAYALPITRFARGVTADKLAYYLGVAAPMWLTWQVGSLMGALLGARIPPAWSFDFAIPLMFLALLRAAIADRPALVAALVGGGVAVAAAGLPYNLGLMLGALAGIGAGLWWEGRVR